MGKASIYWSHYWEIAVNKWEFSQKSQWMPTYKYLNTIWDFQRFPILGLKNTQLHNFPILGLYKNPTKSTLGTASIYWSQYWEIVVNKWEFSQISQWIPTFKYWNPIWDFHKFPILGLKNTQQKWHWEQSHFPNIHIVGIFVGYRYENPSSSRCGNWVFFPVFVFGHWTFFVPSLVFIKGTSCCVIRRNFKWNWAFKSCYGKVL